MVNSAMDCKKGFGLMNVMATPKTADALMLITNHLPDLVWFPFFLAEKAAIAPVINEIAPKSI
jgi:hypothetical protein